MAAVVPPKPANDDSPEQLLRRLDWQVVKRLDGLLQGDFRTLWRGAGVDLADLREYQHHDDVRHIDWNVTARLQTPHVRQFLEDRELTAWFVLDVSGSVDFGSDGITKLAVATGLVATLSRLLTRHGNRVGALLFGQTLQAVVPPRTGRTQVLHILQTLRQPRPQEQSKNAAPSAKPNPQALADMLQAANALVRKRSLVFVVSDFIGRAGWQDALARLSQRHEVVAVRLWDPLEMALPGGAGLGLVTVQDAESGEQLFIDAGDPAFRQRYAQAALAQEEVLLNDLMRSGADVLELATDDDLLHSLMRFVDLRRQRAKLKLPRRFARSVRPDAPGSAAVPVHAAHNPALKGAPA